MTIEDKREVCTTLQELAAARVVSNKAADYPGFGVLLGKRFRIAVHVGIKGATFFTEGMPTFTEDVLWEKIEPDLGINKRRYLFRSLTISQIDANQSQFRKLVSDSIALKEAGF